MMGNIDTLLPWIFLALLGFSAYAGWRALRIYLGVRKRECTISDQPVPPTPSVQPIVARLAALGFQRVGETATQLPGRTRPGITWVLADADGQIHAEVVEHGPGALTCFTSTYGDDAVVETGYPLGEHIESADFRSYAVRDSLEAAYRHQQAQAADFAVRHGTPRRLHDLAEYLTWGGFYRQHYAPRKLRRFFWLGLLRLGAFAYGLLATAAVYLLMPARELHSSLGREWLLVLLLAPALLLVSLAEMLMTLVNWWNQQQRATRV